MPFRPLTPEERAQAQAEKDAELIAVEQALAARVQTSTQTMKAKLAKPEQFDEPDTPPMLAKEDFFLNRQKNPFTPPEAYTKPIQPITDEPEAPRAPRPEKIKMPSADGILEDCIALVRRVIDETPPV